MDFSDSISQHYRREYRQGYGAAILGGLLLITAFIILKTSHPLTIPRGLFMPFTVGGLIFAIGGSVHGFKVRKSLAKGLALYRMDKKSFMDAEVVNVEKTHRSWRRVFGIWTAVALAGVVLLFTAKKQNHTGVALGMVVVSIAGFLEEINSRSFNERYYQLVLDESQKAQEDKTSLKIT
jgi:hypothetical protein